MKRIVIAAFTGALFGTGLLLAGMTRPAKVLGFLDVTHHWDPSLMFVMIGAIAVHAIAYRLIVRRPSPLLEDAFQIPARGAIDARLVGGAIVFGVGWGIGGFCPGPALVSAAAGVTPAIVFSIAMGLGMIGFNRLPGRSPPYPT